MFRFCSDNMKIIPYDARYRDDMIFMVLQAKDALGRVPRLNEDLLDVPGNYLDRGDGFWLALDERDRVIGCVGFSRIPGTEEAFLHRLYVKAAEKRKGIGSALLETAEEEMRRHGIRLSRVHLGEPREQWFELHLALFSPENLLSGALFSAVSTSSGGSCGQLCGRKETLPWRRQICRSPGAFGL